MAMMHLQKLASLVPPLDQPPENVVDWGMVEQEYGLPFPDDFKKLVTTYGNVMWCDLFRPIVPKTDSLNACRKSKAYVLSLLAAMYATQLWDEHGNEVDIPPYPAREGLLPCVIDTNSDIISWYTLGDPDEWKTVLFQ